MSRQSMQKLSQRAFLKDVSSSEEIDQLLTLAELARELDISSQKAIMLAHWAVGYHKVGRRTLISQKNLDQFLIAVSRNDNFNRAKDSYQ